MNYIIILSSILMFVLKITESNILDRRFEDNSLKSSQGRNFVVSGLKPKDSLEAFFPRSVVLG